VQQDFLVQGVVHCQECGMPRAIFCRQALGNLHKGGEVDKGYATNQIDMACNNDRLFTCGAQLFPVGQWLQWPAHLQVLSGDIAVLR
jgi:hypothetical protein